MKLSVLALALVSIAALSSTAVRAEERQTYQTTISLQGVNMDNPAEVARLYKRLERSSKNVCTSEIDYDPKILADDATCAKEALEQAIESIGDKRLMAYHAEKGSSPTLASGRTDKGQLDD